MGRKYNESDTFCSINNSNTPFYRWNKMKNYRQLLKGLPSKTVIMTVGSFNPPTSVNEMALKLVHKLVESHSADHVIYITEDKDNLPTDRKVHFLELMFGSMNFKPLNEENITSELIRLKSKYKHVIVVSPEEKAKLYESMNVVTTGNDIDSTSIKKMITKGDFITFKKQLPTTIRELDAKRLMNEMRQAQGLELLKEEVKFTVDALREKYFKGEIYHIGDIVESNGQQYEIMDRGSNYLVVVNNTGDLSRKWVKDVTLVEAKSLAKACWKGYKAIGLKKKNGKTVPNCVPESVLNPNDPHNDYQAKKKALLDLGKNKDVDQKHVQQRNLDLDKEYKKYKLDEQHTEIEHNSDHKVISHGPHFSFKIHTDHHDKLKNLSHNEHYSFKCMEGTEYGARKVGDKLHFQQHPGDSGIHGNLSVHIPHADFMGDDEKQVSYKGYTTSNFHHAPELAKAFKLIAADAKDPVAMLNAVKTTDAYLDIHNLRGDNPSIDQVKGWKHAHIKAKDALQKIGVFDANQVQYEEAGFKINTLAEALDIGKYSTQNVAQSARSYQAVMKWARAALTQAVDNKEIKQVLDPNISQQIDDLEDWPHETQTKVGHTLAVRDHHRRQKVNYVTENASETDGEVEGQVVTKIKPLPPELSPTTDEPGKVRGKGNSAFFEKKAKNENLDYLDLDSWLRQQSPKAKG